MDRSPAVATALLILTACSPGTADATRSMPQASATGPTSGASASASPNSSASPDSAASPAASESGGRPLTWTERAVSGGPDPREDHTWTVDAAGNVAYLFGGRDGDVVHGDLWAYDLASDAWAEVEDGPAPAARFGHEAVWADGIGLVVFAGQAGPTFFNDLWAFDPEAAAWRQLEASGDVPVERYGSCAAIGPDGRLWISHGFTADGTRFADTVAYDFGTGVWTDETPEGSAPVNRCLHGCWWTDDGSLALYAGQTTGVTALGDRWTLSGGEWTRVEGAAPPDRNLYARARVAGATLVVGGQGVDGGYLSDAWVLDDASADARELDVAGPQPPARAGAELIADPDRDRLLLFGGRDGDGALADLWELSGTLD